MKQKQNNRSFSILILTVFLISILFSCQVEPVVVTSSKEESPLGEKLENPYSVENMQKAWDNIKPKLIASGRISGDEIRIMATHYYVRFLPQDSVELDVLLNDPALELYTYPLDYELNTVGEFYYHDPSIPEDKPTYQYTVVTTAYHFPNVQYEIIEDLYLPEDDAQLTTGRIARVEPCLQAVLVNEAMEITSNFDEIVPLPIDGCGGGSGGGSGGGTGGGGSGGGSNSCSNCPRGQILVENPISGPISRGGRRYDGVPEVKARARKWFKIKTAETNTNGEFVINHVFGGNRKVNYGIKYTNNHALIRPVAIGFGPAFLNGPKQSGRWEYRSHPGSGSYLWGAIMRGVYDYHHLWSPQLGIGTPPNDIKIRACSNNDCGVTTMLHKTSTASGSLLGRWLFSDIRIGGESGNNTEYRELYSTVIHELGHAAHWKLSGDWIVGSDINMVLSSKLVREAWASGINDLIHKLKFPAIGNYYFGTCSSNERLRLQRMLSDGYPRILVRDLMDNINEFNAANNNCNDLNDDVEGLTISQIFYALQDTEGTLFGKSAMEKWRDHLIERDNTQETELIEYFEPWIE